MAGPEGGIDAKPGEEEVKLGGDAGGPWGNNLVYSWRRAAGTTVDPSATNIQEPTLTAPVLAEAVALECELTVTARGTSLTATDRVTVRVAAAVTVSSVALSSRPIADSTYRRGEKIEAAVTFSKPVTVTGMPLLALSVGAGTRDAIYVEGSSSPRRLVFEYTVADGDADGDGIAIGANSLALGTDGAIVDADGAVALRDHDALAAQSGHKVTGSGNPALTGGICNRTAQVRDKLVELVKAKPGNSGIANCSLVDPGVHLAALTGELQLGGAGIATLKPGDFADLGGIVQLGLNTNDLSSLPPAIFEKLTNLTLLSLSGNRLSSLPPRIFEKLTGLAELHLEVNPGTARFKPTAKAGPAGGVDVASGGSVTLGVEVPENEPADPWGTNVAYSWSRTEGTGGTLTNENTARATFTAPAADGTHTFMLTVTGGGGVAATSTVNVRVGAAALPLMPDSAVVDGNTLTLAYGEDLQQTNPAGVSAKGKGPVYFPVVSEPWERRSIEGRPPSAVRVEGNQVILTLDPPAGYNQKVTLSYFRDNATAASKVRGLGGILADAFVGFRVRNETLEGTTIKNIALTGEAKTYRIGDTVGIAVTFTEAVDVTGAPTLALEIGAAARKAAYVRGSGSAVLNFEYPIVLGEEDTDGIAVEANGLAVPAGGSILDTADREAAILRHGRYHFPDRGVDGVRPTPTPDPAVSAGPGVSIAWTEPLDATAVPAGAGGFTVNVPGAANPVVTAVTISGSVVNLALNAPIALGTTGVTVDYTPTATPIRDAAGNAAEAFASPLAVTVAEDETAPALSAAVVNGDTLTLTYSEPLKVTSPAASVFGVSVTGGGTLAVSNIRAGVGPGNTRVTMTLDPPAQAGQTITVSHTPGNGTTATGIQDLAGIAAIGFAATTALDPPVTLDNRTGAPTLALSKPQVTEGDDAEVTLTLSTGGTTYATDRTFTISAGADATALETEDWSLPSTSVVLRAGQDTVTATLAIVDDARLEPAETVSFKASLGGAETAAATLAIADDDRAVLTVQGPAQPVTEGGAIELTLRLEPHPDNVANAAAVPDEACILDFPVSATLTRAGDTAAALPPGAMLETDHVFDATAFDDCPREVTVSVPTSASDGVWMADRTLTFALAPQQGTDPRVVAGEPLQATVRDDTPPPGPMVTSVAITPMPAEASEEHGPRYSKEAFLALPAGAVHGPGIRLTFKLTFDTAVTVTPDPQTRALPELVLDIFGRERRARYDGGSGTQELTFHWTVAKGDNDPDGLKIRSIDLAGATIRFASGCQGNDPCDMDVGTFKNEHGKRHKAHRVRGGLHAMRLAVSGSAREGEPFTVTVRRDGGYREPAHAIVRMTDSGMESPALGEESAVNHGVRLMSFPFDADPKQGPDSRVSVETVTPPGDGAADARTLKLELTATDVGDGGVSYWYVTGDPVEVTVAVADTGLARGTPDTPSLGVWDAWTREPTPEQWDRGTRFPLLFDVTVPWPNVLRPRGDGTVTVRYETRDGTAVAGEDYVAGADYKHTRGTLTFEAGETRKTVEVEVWPDTHDEGVETMTLVLSDATGAAIARAEAVGTIRNNGPIPKAWIARFGRTVAEQVLEAVEGRMRAAPAPGAEVALAGERIGGQSPDPGSEAGTGRGPGQAEPGSEAERDARREEGARRDTLRLADWLKGETDPEEAARRSRAVTPRDLLTGSSFALTAETAGKDLVSLWGRGAVTRFDGREGELTLDGEVVTGMLGAEWTRGRWTAGLIVSHSVGEGGYSDGSGTGSASGTGPGSGSGASGRVEATLTGLFPWARHALSERLEAWGAAGYGAGELTVTPKKPGTDEDGATIRADLDLRMAAAGLRGVLLDPGSGSGFQLTGKTDAMVVQTSSGRGKGADGGNMEPARATVTRLRLGLEASRPFALGPGSGSGAGGGEVLTPSLEIGVRHDGGDAETGFGLDLGGGLALSDPKRGLQAELRGRGLLAHESKGFRDLGFSGALAWEGKPGSDRGAKLRLTQTLGGSSSGGADALLARTTLEGLAANDNGEGGNDELKSRRLELKFGYGLSAFGDRFTWTPEIGVGLSDTGRDYSLGWRLVRGGFGGDGGSLELSFEATRRESANDDTPPEHEVGFRLTARF